jgi:hypothetical protein
MEFLFDILGLCVFLGVFIAFSMESKVCPAIKNDVQNQINNAVQNKITVADGKS